MKKGLEDIDELIVERKVSRGFNQRTRYSKSLETAQGRAPPCTTESGNTWVSITDLQNHTQLLLTGIQTEDCNFTLRSKFHTMLTGRLQQFSMFQCTSECYLNLLRVVGGKSTLHTRCAAILARKAGRPVKNHLDRRSFLGKSWPSPKSHRSTDVC